MKDSTPGREESTQRTVVQDIQRELSEVRRLERQGDKVLPSRKSWLEASLDAAENPDDPTLQEKATKAWDTHRQTTSGTRGLPPGSGQTPPTGKTRRSR